MKYFILSGSHRENSQSKKVALYLKKSIERLFPEDECFLYSLENNPLPLWDEGLWNGSDLWKEKWNPIKAQLEESDAFICVSPEWGGMASPGVKNFLLLCSGGPISHKPGYLCSVSASRNGAYPIAELRMTSGKNNQCNWIPEHLIVRDVESVMNGEISVNESDEYIRKRADYGLHLLREYSKALKQVRNSGVLDPKNFPNGM